MSTQKGNKHKRSIQDAPVDLTKMQLARQRLSALQEELSGIEETETEMEEIMKHVDALQGILGSTKKFKISFSAVQRSDLSNMGLERKPLRFNDTALKAHIAASDINPKHIEALC
ncbi:hypothetical protein AX14_002732 [Amanita brunnescens Koide BX004]|nr:hypothetical protein AX14_002732 [Amanita brunnescens Koide BX004]